ncbi:MAG: hypothetical protein JWN70_5548, partial [Planctomycetaceae bacterium]|nr:hypothetical protein [Planctomycetaceae bacterium]
MTMLKSILLGAVLVTCSGGLCQADEVADTCKIYFEKINSKDGDAKFEGWARITTVSRSCPGHPALKEGLLIVLKDEAQRDDWFLAFGHLYLCLKCDPRLDDADVQLLLSRLAKDDVGAWDIAVRCISALVLHSETAVKHLEPFLKDPYERRRDLVAKSILSLNGQ